MLVPEACLRGAVFEKEGKEAESKTETMWGMAWHDDCLHARLRALA